MFRINTYLTKIKDRKKNYNNNVEYNPLNVESILVKFNEMNKYINNLENSLKIAESKTHKYEDILQKYKRVIKEEITLYHLHKSNISILNQKVNENDIFMRELKQQFESFVHTDDDNGTVDNIKYDNSIDTFRRIISRFFHQNEIFKSRTQEKITELDETIEKKNRQLERMNVEIESWDHDEEKIYIPTHQAIPLKQACGL